MNRSKVIKRKLILLFGEKAYHYNGLNRSYLSGKIFNDKSLLNKMNSIVHPKVHAHFKRWLKKQTAPYVLKEVAIIFENNLEAQYNYIITVVANQDERISRVMKRDAKSKPDVLAIVNNQWSDEEKIKKSDFVIQNNDLAESKKQAEFIHKTLLTLINSSKF
jgi:dephospho-CoA kinase